METKETIDVYEILKQCATEGMKLWSPIVGDCTFKGLRTDVKLIVVEFTDCNNDSCEWKFRSNGFTASAAEASSAEVSLFPSKGMRDWEKLLWKKGDVLSDVEGNEVMFDQWDDSDYSSFRALYDIIPDGAGFKISKDTEGYSTKDYWKTNDSIREDFLATIEKHAHYKFNEETKAFEPYFKDGDIVTVYVDNDRCKHIVIFKDFITLENPKLRGHAEYVVYDDECIKTVEINVEKRYYRPATEEEKHLLFSKLEEKGKRWNPDTKQIEDVKKEHEFKPFERVLVRDEPDDYWQANLFSCMNGKDPINQFACVCEVWKHCIPYNEKTAHLLGTNDDYEEEEL